MHTRTAWRILARVAALAAASMALLLAPAQARAAGEFIFAVARLPLSLPIFVAQAKGYFADEQLPIKIVDCEIGRQCLEQMLQGQAHLATVAESPIVFASLRGERFSIIATIATARGYNKIITRRGRGIATVADLSGKRVGTYVGASAQYFLDLNLLWSGIDPTRMKVVPIQPAQSAQASVLDGVDAVAIFEPFAFSLVRSLGAQALVLPSELVHADTWSVLIRADVAGKRDADLKSLLRALERSRRFIASEPQQARAILQKHLGLDEAAINWAWADVAYTLELRQSLVKGLEGQTRWALRAGHATGKLPNFLEYIHPGPLKAVRPGAVSIVH